MGYAISRILNQMILDQYSSNYVSNKDLIDSKSKIGQWYPIVFFSQNMITIEILYKTHHHKLLNIVEIFKT